MQGFLIIQKGLETSRELINRVIAAKKNTNHPAPGILKSLKTSLFHLT
jgi:hypothetical protein